MAPLKLQALTAQAFAPYGWVIAVAPGGAGQAINQGSCLRHDQPGALDLQREGGRPLMALFRAQARGLAGPWRELERHRLGSQTFIALAGARCVALVATATPGGDAPDVATLAAFEVPGDQAYTLHAGTWHHGLIAPEGGDFVVIERGGHPGAAVDCDIHQLAHAVHLQATD